MYHFKKRSEVMVSLRGCETAIFGAFETVRNRAETGLKRGRNRRRGTQAKPRNHHPIRVVSTVSVPGRPA
jgi:hypothetical protein